VLGATFDFWSKDGFAYLSRWGHVVVGITWIGLLYYFNFVQVPAFGEMEAAARNNAIDKLASRALWWFRWAAVATVVTGLLILYFQRQLDDMDYFKTRQGAGIAFGILLALTMFVNVWGFFWRMQKVVIANARNVQAGGAPDPAAAEAGRRAALASRMNTIFSLPMLVFMVGTTHFPWKDITGNPGGSDRGIYWLIMLVVWILFELNALGVIGGLEPGGTNIIYDTHRNTLITGFVYAAFVIVVYALALT
jgi:uncharacterized membrane protein